MKLAMKILIGGLIILMASCGPSAEEIATMTASAWTPTPTQTPIPPSPTPLPIDVTVTVMDESGAPVAGANISFPESGDDTPVLTDEAGQVHWNDLLEDTATFNVTAQGYLPASSNSALVRGPNEVAVTVQRDPMGVLPAEACVSGQTLLYVEDFQDGTAQGWPYISLGTGGDMPNGWSLADEDGNKILLNANAPSGGGDTLEGYTFDNFVWHIKYKPVGTDADMFFMWRLSQSDAGQKRYVVVVGGGVKPWMVRFLDNQSGPNPMNIGQTSFRLIDGQWYSLDIAYFDGVHQVWVDGKKIMEYKDPQPYPEGTIGFETHLDQGKTSQFFIDDLVICELTEPFVSPASSTP